jgi:hypothetical protein
MGNDLFLSAVKLIISNVYRIGRSPEYLTPKLLTRFCLHYPSQARGKLMFPSERRTTRRRKLHLELRFHRQNAPAEDENEATSVNVSKSGVNFISNLPILVGEKIEVSMKMPRQITGEKASNRLFTGRVTHVDSQGAPPGFSRIGVHFLYYQLESGKGQSCGVTLSQFDPGQQSEAMTRAWGDK